MLHVTCYSKLSSATSVNKCPSSRANACSQKYDISIVYGESPQQCKTPLTVRADIINMGLLFKCLLGTPQRTGDESSPLREEDCSDEQKEGEQKDNNQNICRENFSKETVQNEGILEFMLESALGGSLLSRHC